MTYEQKIKEIFSKEKLNLILFKKTEKNLENNREEIIGRNCFYNFIYEYENENIITKNKLTIEIKESFSRKEINMTTSLSYKIPVFENKLAIMNLKTELKKLTAEEYKKSDLKRLEKILDPEIKFKDKGEKGYEIFEETDKILTLPQNLKEEELNKINEKIEDEILTFDNVYFSQNDLCDYILFFFHEKIEPLLKNLKDKKLIDYEKLTTNTFKVEFDGQFLINSEYANYIYLYRTEIKRILKENGFDVETIPRKDYKYMKLKENEAK